MYLCPQSFSSKNAMWVEKTTTSTNGRKKKTTRTLNRICPLFHEIIPILKDVLYNIVTYG
jgi:hypothetical protein